MNTRDKIIQTASSLFQLQGYHATGLTQILEQSATPKGSMYYHFPQGKEQLAVEAIKYMKEFVQEKNEDILENYEDAVEAIQRIILDVADHFEKDDHAPGFPVGLLAAETASTSELLQQACQQAFEAWEGGYYKKLTANGWDEASAQDMAIVINSLIEGSILRALANKSSKPLRIAAAQIPQLLQRK
ncbi:TetR/AcrR family transcriptional regulator [Priestia koreensis]|uniref:TetR/AcrR family transcriptional regulator n=1 Tax=Priestia koreensis TaxID=284581 RepID=UPI003CFBD046